MARPDRCPRLLTGAQLVADATAGRCHARDVIRHCEPEFAFHTPQARAGALLIRSLNDTALLAAATNPDSAAFAEVLVRLGPDTNPDWITGVAAETAYTRQLIDEQRLDLLTR